MKKIFFSSGHTASRPGAIVGDLDEYQIAYDITRNLADIFIGDKRIVFSYNQPLANKIEWINDHAPELGLAIELHFNAAYREAASGTETWYWSETGKVFAEIFQNNLLELGKEDRGIKHGAYWRLINGKKVWYTLGFLRRTIPPAIILEPLFLTNLENAAAIRRKDFRELLIKKISQGLQQALSVIYL